MRIVIEISDAQAQASAADARPMITVDNAAQSVSTGSDALSGGAFGGVSAFLPSGEALDAISGGAAEAFGAPSTTIGAATDFDGGAGPI